MLDLLTWPDAALMVEEIGRIVLSLIGKALEFVAANGTQPLDADHVISSRSQTLEQQITVLVGKIILPGFSHFPGKVHTALVINVEKLQHSNE
ncbi:MAG: hypothetical protein WBB23_03600 [Desulforhopalus sp.]